ncbi:hypothetical protein DY000_02040862 [Brassica cretica]|uniref:Uncharacterized protein n=1 Tax=Brassica cretica TaxID=69181 RepID=A0ABQ7BAZ9_BRACR|nr:hypothetical protein DY000_02040862 [Brassica cretica]
MQRGRDDVTYYDHVQKSCPSARQYGTYHSRRSFMRSYRDIGRPIEKIRKEGADPMDEDNDQRKLSAMKLDGIEEGYANMDGLPGN